LLNEIIVITNASLRLTLSRVRLRASPSPFLCLPRIAALKLAFDLLASMILSRGHTQTVRCRHGTVGGNSSSSVLLPHRSFSLVVRAASEPTSSQDEETQQAQIDAAQALQDRAFPKTGLFSIADPNAEVCAVAAAIQPTHACAWNVET
jgi:hypothetical protein